MHSFLKILILGLILSALSSRVQAEFTGHVSIINSVEFSANGKIALSGSWDWTMRLWEVESQKSLRRFKSHTLSVNSVTFSPDSKTALSASADGTLKHWEIASGKVGSTPNICVEGGAAS